MKKKEFDKLKEEIEDLDRRGCIINKMNGKYGPYRYWVVKIKQEQYWKYLGKTKEGK